MNQGLLPHPPSNLLGWLLMVKLALGTDGGMGGLVGCWGVPGPLRGVSVGGEGMGQGDKNVLVPGGSSERASLGLRPVTGFSQS